MKTWKMYSQNKCLVICFQIIQRNKHKNREKKQTKKGDMLGEVGKEGKKEKKQNKTTTTTTTTKNRWMFRCWGTHCFSFEINMLCLLKTHALGLFSHPGPVEALRLLCGLVHTARRQPSRLDVLVTSRCC